jgi:hypothetical protein
MMSCTASAACGVVLSPHPAKFEFKKPVRLLGFPLGLVGRSIWFIAHQSCLCRTPCFILSIRGMQETHSTSLADCAASRYP